MPRTSNEDFAAIREGLRKLDPSPSVNAGTAIDPKQIVVVQSHRAALDPDRSLVVGNRGVGKSFWTQVLAAPDARAVVAKSFRELAAVDVTIGFNASDRVVSVAPTKQTINQAFAEAKDAEALWRAVLVRAARDRGVAVPLNTPSGNLGKEAVWARDNGEQADRILTTLDDQYTNAKKKLVLVFDALDQLGTDWESKRELTTGLLKRTLGIRSYQSIRLKLFMRRDQFEDPQLLQFPDGSKLANARVDLQWNSSELYTLLFAWLASEPSSSSAFRRLRTTLGVSEKPSTDDHKALVDSIAGEFMGATKKQGRVYTWLPLHLSDARGETSPRTFLTAWREAAVAEPAPTRRALDHRGLHEGVRKASSDRVAELKEDYWWISLALEPLRRQLVPMDRVALKRLWRNKETPKEILKQSSAPDRLPPVRLESAKTFSDNLEDALIKDLEAIGIIEVRPNGKINVPDIFRLEADIGRKGGVPAPKRAQRQ
jgi:hypothetical protein